MIRRTIDFLRRRGAFEEYKIIGTGKRKEGTLVKLRDFSKRAYGRAHGTFGNEPELQDFEGLSNDEGRMEGRGLEHRIEEQRISITPPLPPTPEETELISYGGRVLGEIPSLQAQATFVHTLRSSPNVLTHQALMKRFDYIAAHPVLKATTKSINRVFHMKTVYAEAARIDAEAEQMIATYRARGFSQAAARVDFSAAHGANGQAYLAYYAKRFEIIFGS
jgi:hypothetical protein